MRKVFLLAIFLCASGAAATPVDVLARILASRGVITADELGRVEAAGPDGGLRLLAELLREKGVLTEVDAARVQALAGTTGSTSVDARMVPAVYSPPGASMPGALPASALPTQAVPASGSPGPAAGQDAPSVTSKSKLPITVYGTILLNSFFDTAGTNNQAVPLLLTKQGTDPLGGAKSYGMTVRQSRFGATVTGPDFGGATTSGVFEFDLFGGQSALPNAIGFELSRLRRSYANIESGIVWLTAGQDWSIFAPLNPASFADYAIPEFAASGNPWIREPQLRLDVKQNVGDSLKMLYQFAVTDPNLGDYNTAAFLTARVPGIGERGRMPGLEGRVAFTGSIDGRDATFGVSGHYGRGENSGILDKIDYKLPVNSWGAAVDYLIPFTARLNWTGELYIGRALGVYSVGLGEDVLPVGGPGQYGVLSGGGWTQRQFMATKKIQLNAGYGVDAERNRELPVGNRNNNQSASASLFYKWSPAVTFAWEYRRMLTNYRNQPFYNEQGDNLNMAVAYSF